MHTAIDSLLLAARLAPSGDNTQPWDFTVERSENRVTILSNPTRDPSPMNAGDRMSRIAIGAAVENMLQMASANGWEFEVDYTEASVSIRMQQSYEPADLSPTLHDRVSNRRKYDGREVPRQVSETLSQSVAAEALAQANWVTQISERRDLCELIGKADACMLSNEQIRKAFLAKVRFDQPSTAVVDEGLSLGSLELSAAERAGLRMMRWMPNILLQIGGAKKTFRSTALKLARSASGFCVVTSKDDMPRTDYDVGRVLQRSWLSLTELGFAVQPMMSLLVLRNIQDNGSQELKRQLNPQGISDLLSQFSNLPALRDRGMPAAMLRFGYAKPPTARTGRLSIEKMLVRE